MTCHCQCLHKIKHCRAKRTLPHEKQRIGMIILTSDSGCAEKDITETYES